jgi:hypothetical protein
MDLKTIASQKAAEVLTGKQGGSSTFAQKLAEMSPKAQAPESEEPSDDDFAREAAGSKLLSAFQSKDPKQLTSALLDALEILGVSVPGYDKES